MLPSQRPLRVPGKLGAARLVEQGGGQGGDTARAGSKHPQQAPSRLLGDSPGWWPGHGDGQAMLSPGRVHTQAGAGCSKPVSGLVREEGRQSQPCPAALASEQGSGEL